MIIQQVLAKLNCFNIRPAAVPIRLNDAEEEEINEDVDTDELLRSLGPKNMVRMQLQYICISSENYLLIVIR